jgi:hypothetical protein
LIGTVVRVKQLTEAVNDADGSRRRDERTNYATLKYMLQSKATQYKNY